MRDVERSFDGYDPVEGAGEFTARSLSDVEIHDVVPVRREARPPLNPRAPELSLARRALSAARRTGVPAILRVAGEAGIGKTHLLNELADAARADGWFVLETACHDIQRNTPFMVTNRLVSAAIRQLGADADRYTGGLEEGLASFDRSLANLFRIETSVTLDSTRYQDVFSRLLEGIGADHHLLLICDDVQWSDEQSREMLSLLASRFMVGPLAIVYGERVASLDDVAGDTIALRPLEDRMARAFVTERFPQLSDVLLQTIVDHGKGRPFDLLTLAEETSRSEEPGEGGERSARELIAGRARRLPTEDQEFLQLCALLGEPIEFRILFALYPEAERVARLVGQVGRPYLVADGPTLRFRHALVGEALQTTVEFEGLLRRRIIETLQSLKTPELLDFERIAEHARALGDEAGIFDAYSSEAEIALSRRAWDAAVAAYERAKAIRGMVPKDPIRTAVGYAIALRSINRDADAAEVLTNVLRDAELLAAPPAGASSAVVLLLATLFTLERTEQAQRVYDRWTAVITNEAELSEIVAIGMFVAAMEWSEDAFDARRQRFDSLKASATSTASTYAFMAIAVRNSGRDHYTEAVAAIEQAMSQVANTRSRQSELLPFTAAVIDFRHRGCDAGLLPMPDLLRRTRLGNQNVFSGVFFQAFMTLAKGDWTRAMEMVDDVADTRVETGIGARLFVIPAMIAALQGQPAKHDRRIRAMIEGALQERCHEAFLVLAPWWLLTQSDAPVERELLRRVRSPDWGACPRWLEISYSPLALTMMAKARGLTDVLEILAKAPPPADSCPWSVAQWNLGRGSALKQLDRASASEVLQQAADGFERLGAQLFKALAAFHAGAPDDASQKMLQSVGLIGSGTGRAAAKAKDRFGLTPREWQVATIVSQGKTNKQVAEALLLSERTVEVHLGNVFGKLQIESRVNLARWFFENAPAGA